MTLDNTCRHCGAFMMIPERHHCPPKWLAWGDDQSEEDARELYAHDAAEAAELWAKHDDADSAEYLIVGGTDATVYVRPAAGGDVKRFTVSGEAVPQYTAKEAEAT